MAIKLRTWRVALLAGCATAALATALPAAASAEGPARNYAIGAQDLDAALRAFAMASGHDVVFDPAVVKGRTTAGVNGAVSDEAALRALLAGTDLAFEQTPSGGFVVRAPRFQADAEGGSADSGTVQALIVTAQKREEDIQDVPIAISAFTQEDLTRSQVAGGPDLMTQVPNFTFTKTNFSGYSIQIRGIGTQAISATTDAAVAVAFNNTPFIRNRFFEQEFYDLERAEVLRGPQGTLYGRNATAGVVNIISAKPKFHYEAKLSGDIGNYGSHRLEGMINMPLVEDKAALRFAGAWTKRDGYAMNQITGNPIDGRDLWSTRVSLRIEPNDRFRANLIWEHFQENDDRLRSGKQLCNKDKPTEIGGIPLDPNDTGFQGAAATYSQGCKAGSMYSAESFQTPNGLALPYYNALVGIGLPAPGGDPYVSATQSRDLRVIESTVDPEYRANSNVVELQLGASLTSHLTLASETGFSNDTIFSLEDYNRFNTRPGVFFDSALDRGVDRDGVLVHGVFCDPQLGCSNRVVAVDLSTAKSDQFSQEFRLSSNFDGPFNFSLGANFLRYDTEDKYYVFFNTTTLNAMSQAFGISGNLPAYVPGVSDNHECFSGAGGPLPGDPFAQQHVTGCIYVDPNPIDSLNDEGHNYFLSRNPYKLISYAAFGEAYYNVTDTLKVTAGLRWTVDRKQAPQILSWLLSADTVGYPVAEVVNQEWREPTGRLSIDWRPELSFTEQTLIYASYGHGYKAGGANPPPTTIIGYSDIGGAGELAKLATHPRTFEPEFVDAFEFGTKNTLLDGGLTLNGDIFYYDYTGYQISEIVDRAAVNHNFDAKVWGAELEADWRPLRNLRLGFKGGYENTRVADGMKAIDLMDRTAGDPNWMVARPFPSIPSNCIVPTYVVTFGGRINIPGDGSIPDNGLCVRLYQENLDPVTILPYVADPQVMAVNGGSSIVPLSSAWAGYKGFDPMSAPNHGEGVFKQLGGNELPNAPHFTATVTADYTIPLPSDWLLTLHADYYHQSAAWTRIFNFNPYDRLKPYTNVNFAAILTNEAQGWTAMAYVKNVLDKDAITGAFLNSDDSGLTTNVFLLEPRLYGLRVTKTWSDAGWFGGLQRHEPGRPYPLRLELGGDVEHETAPYATIRPSFADAFPTAIDPLAVQHRSLDWGDAREAKLTYTSGGGAWFVSGGVRFGKSNGDAKLTRSMKGTGGCFLSQEVCDQGILPVKYSTDFSTAKVNERSDHLSADFLVGKDFGIGALGAGGRSKAAFGLRYARLRSETSLNLTGIPDWQLPSQYLASIPAKSHRYSATLEADRSFKGVGPQVAWEASTPILGNDQIGHLDLDWNLGAGVLFGRQKVSVDGSEVADYYSTDKYTISFKDKVTTTTPIHRTRNHTATVPVLNLDLGFSYEIERFKVSTGYRFERYFNAIDGGDQTRKSYDRTIQGPYFKIAVGFGG